MLLSVVKREEAPRIAKTLPEKKPRKTRRDIRAMFDVSHDIPPNYFRDNNADKADARINSRRKHEKRIAVSARGEV